MLRMKEYIDFVSIYNFIQFKSENRIAVIIFTMKFHQLIWLICSLF